ncbi:unnamed protein product [Trichogramma brassicae]|uniref:Uncharacterized protein n=1 Tax=Trichogramma brassicae TaxID=86971 RepID=A0A6H5IUZ3_9HYME|nr:unnamed protein product [Trichogramma brassicae]
MSAGGWRSRLSTSTPCKCSRLLRGHTLLASPPELDIFFRTRCLVPSCECGSRFRRHHAFQLSLGSRIRRPLFKIQDCCHMTSSMSIKVTVTVNFCKIVSNSRLLSYDMLYKQQSNCNKHAFRPPLVTGE